MGKNQTITNKEILLKLAELTNQIQIKNTEIKKDKRHKGSYQLMSDGTAKLQFMLKGERFYDRRPAKNDQEAKQVLAIFVNECEKGIIASLNYTFADFSQYYIDHKARNIHDERYVTKMIGALNNRILPYLGKYQLKDINKTVLESYFNTIKNEKTNYENRNENHTLKPATIQKWKNYISAILSYAEDLQLINRNWCKGLKINYSSTTDIDTIRNLIKQKKQEIHYYNSEEFKRACTILENEFNYFYDSDLPQKKKLTELARRLIILLALKTGMRRSEIFGLAKSEEFNDLDLDKATFSVNKSRHYSKENGRYTKYPKNDSSIRTKSLPKSILSYIKMYYDYLSSIEYKNDYIFDFISIDGICSWFDKWQKSNNLPNITFHDLRHCHATILLSLGVNIKTISERLGHANIQTTLDIYAGVLEKMDIEAAEKIDLL